MLDMTQPCTYAYFDTFPPVEGDAGTVNAAGTWACCGISLILSVDLQQFGLKASSFSAVFPYMSSSLTERR